MRGTIVSYPKCGRTWLETMMNSAAGERIVTSKHQRAKKGHYTIYLTRDPRDVLVSLFFERSRRNKLWGQKCYHGSIAAFIKTEAQDLIAYYNKWADLLAAVGTETSICTMTRYEVLRAKPASELTRLLLFLEACPHPDNAAWAVQHCSFDNMKKRERKLTLRGRIGPKLRAGNVKDPESYKVRRGIVGGYKDYLSAADIEWLNRKLKKDLSGFYKWYR